MAENKFDISWNTFEEHLRSTRKQLFVTKRFCNVTLVSDSMAQFQCHKSVLSCASKVLEKLLDIDQGPGCILYLRGIQDTELSSLLEFIYLGQTFVSQEKLADFARAANELNIEGLSDALNQKECDDAESEEEIEEELVDGPSQMINTQDLKHEELESTETELSRPEAEQEDTLPPTKESKMEPHEEDYIVDQPDSNESHMSKVLPEGNILCIKCDKVLRDRGSFKRHFHAVHAKVKQKCPECGKLFHRFSLKRHREMIHEGIKYPCEFCAYIAAHKNAIKLHMKSSHNKEFGANHEFTKYTASKSN